MFSEIVKLWRLQVLWQYWLWSFKFWNTKLGRFLPTRPTNEQIQRKEWYFLKWNNAEKTHFSQKLLTWQKVSTRKSYIDNKTELNFVLKCSLKMEKITVKSPVIAIIGLQKIHLKKYFCSFLPKNLSNYCILKLKTPQPFCQNK